MGDLKIRAWVFIDFGINLWENPEEAKSLARWEIVHDYGKALEKAKRLGMHGDYFIDTSSDRTTRMLAIFESELEQIEDWDSYVRNYVTSLTESLKNPVLRSGCGCGMLTGKCGCSSGCSCGSSESCKCEGGE